MRTRDLLALTGIALNLEPTRPDSTYRVAKPTDIVLLQERLSSIQPSLLSLESVGQCQLPYVTLGRLKFQRGVGMCYRFL